jgi:hypothetical protein
VNHFGFEFSGGGEDDGGSEDERASDPGCGAEFVSEELDAQDRAERRLYVEEDSGPGCGNVMNAPVPKECCGGGAEQASSGAGEPDFGAQAMDGWQAVDGKYPENEHNGAGEDGVDGNRHGRVAVHEIAVEKDPSERDDEGEDDEKISNEGGAVRGLRMACAAEGDEGDASG